MFPRCERFFWQHGDREPSWQAAYAHVSFFAFAALFLLCDGAIREGPRHSPPAATGQRCGADLSELAAMSRSPLVLPCRWGPRKRRQTLQFAPPRHDIAERNAREEDNLKQTYWTRALLERFGCARFQSVKPQCRVERRRRTFVQSVARFDFP